MKTKEVIAKIDWALTLTSMKVGDVITIKEMFEYKRAITSANVAKSAGKGVWSVSCKNRAPFFTVTRKS